MRDHGGNIDGAIRAFGGARGDWIDLSTGINRVPYPVPSLPLAAWTALPTQSEMGALCDAARAAYGTGAAVLPLAGAQMAIQLLPRLLPRGEARVLGPTYNEHAAALAGGGWSVTEVPDATGLAGADLAVIVNPNNPDGRTLAPDEVLALAGRVGRLIVDESFADPHPGLSVAGQAGQHGLIVLRSFGKFYGLAGLRLGFALGGTADIEALSVLNGPWPVSGAAIAVGQQALLDREWAERTTGRLMGEADRMDAIAARAGWETVGGTALFRLYSAPNAAEAQDRLAGARIWSRRFPYSETWLRLGLPGDAAEWQRLEASLGL